MIFIAKKDAYNLITMSRGLHTFEDIDCLSILCIMYIQEGPARSWGTFKSPGGPLLDHRGPSWPRDSTNRFEIKY